jgi:hypothetical protein
VTSSPKDPIGEKGGVNLYAMVGNGVVNAWDYLGKSCAQCGNSQGTGEHFQGCIALGNNTASFNGFDALTGGGVLSPGANIGPSASIPTPPGTVSTGDIINVINNLPKEQQNSYEYEILIFKRTDKDNNNNINEEFVYPGISCSNKGETKQFITNKDSNPMTIQLCHKKSSPISKEIKRVRRTSSQLKLTSTCECNDNNELKWSDYSVEDYDDKDSSDSLMITYKLQ